MTRMGKSGRFGRVNPAKDVHFGRANQAKNVHLSRVGKPSKNRPFYPRGQTKKKLSILPEWVNTAKNVHFAREHLYTAHARTNRKDDIYMQRRLFIDEAHTALDIFSFAVFF